jgi:electron transfer flavoprotein beta subunit
MQILVTVKEVAVLDDEFEIDDGIDDRYVTRELNEWDEYAIETAVQLQEAGEDIEVVTVTIGPEDCEETIRQALAKGPDRAIRLWDDALADAGLLDPATKARLLAAVADDLDPDLVLTGVQSADDGFGATGVTLAERLGFEWAAVVNALDLDGGVASVHRELEGGVEELLDVELPAVLTIQTGINDPRYASLRGIRSAQSKPLDVRSLADLGLDSGDIESPLTQTSLYTPESDGEATLLEGDAETAATELADLLRDQGVGQ